MDKRAGRFGDPLFFILSLPIPLHTEVELPQRLLMTVD